MSKNLHSLLEQAALLRSCGASWDAVARKVGRRTGTCRAWPKRHADVWHPLYREASFARYEELGNEAEMTLRHLLRDEDKKWQVKSAEVLLRHRGMPEATPYLLAPAQTPPADAGGSPAEMPPERIEPEVWHCLYVETRYQFNEWRADRDLPPALTIAEMEAELLEYFRFDEKCATDPVFKAAYQERGIQRHKEQQARRRETEETPPPAPPRSVEGRNTNTHGMFAMSVLMLVGALATMGLAFGLASLEKHVANRPESTPIVDHDGWASREIMPMAMPRSSANDVSKIAAPFRPAPQAPSLSIAASAARCSGVSLASASRAVCRGEGVQTASECALPLSGYAVFVEES